MVVINYSVHSVYVCVYKYIGILEEFGLVIHLEVEVQHTY